MQGADAITGVAGHEVTAARVLARKGRYHEATTLLQNGLDADECPRPESLDLLARIYAQQGRYAEAESCWLEAKRVDGSNPSYDIALSRLRRIHRTSGRFVQGAILVVVLGSLTILLWQAFRWTSDHHASTNATLLALRGDITTLQQATQTRNHELGDAAADVRGLLLDLDSRVQRQLRTLVKTGDMEKQRDAVITHVDEQMTVLQDHFYTTGRQAEQYARLNAAQSHQIETLKVSVADVQKALAVVDGKLGEYVSELERVETSVMGDIKELPTSADLSRIKQSIELEADSLGKHFAKLTSEQIKEFEATKASVMELRKALSAIDIRLEEGINEARSNDTAIRADIRSMSNVLTAISQSVLSLQDQLAELSAAIGRGKDIRSGGNASDPPSEAGEDESVHESKEQP